MTAYKGKERKILNRIPRRRWLDYADEDPSQESLDRKQDKRSKSIQDAKDSVRRLGHQGIKYLKMIL